jgi:hypothetical protein
LVLHISTSYQGSVTTDVINYSPNLAIVNSFILIQGCAKLRFVANCPPLILIKK